MYIRVLWKYLHKWGHYLKVVFNYCCGRYSRTLLRHPHAFDFAFVYVRFVFFRLACRDFLLLLCYYVVFCVVLFISFFFFWQITLINYFYQSGKWGQWQVPAVVPISPICLGLVCQLTIRFFSRALHFPPCFACLLFYSMLFYSVCRLMAWNIV